MRCHRSPLLKAGFRALISEGKSHPIVQRGFATEAQLPTPQSQPQTTVFEDALSATKPRNTWTKEQIKEIYETPLMNLAFAAVSFQAFKKT